MIETNLKKVSKQLGKISTRLRKRALRTPSKNKLVLNEYARKVRGDILSSMLSDPKTGETYKFGGKTHQASAPGESPAVFRGRLVKAIAYDIDGKKRVTLELGALAKAPHAKYLEFGTRKYGFSFGSVMEPRPFLEVNALKHINYLRKNIKDKILDIHLDVEKLPYKGL